MVEFAEIVEVVNVIANALGISGFAARWKPYVADADGLELRDLLGEAFPVLVVVRNIPFKALEKGFVFGCRFLFWGCVSLES